MIHRYLSICSIVLGLRAVRVHVPNIWVLGVFLVLVLAVQGLSKDTVMTYLNAEGEFI